MVHAALLITALLGTAPRSHADFDRLQEKLGAADVKVRRAAVDTIVDVDADSRSLYLQRLQRHPFQRYTEKQRLLLMAAGVKLPGPTGWFNIPKLKMGEKAPYDVDMLEALLPRPVPGGGVQRGAHVRALETLAIVRGLGGMRDLRVAEPLIRFAFSSYGITFRWAVVQAIRGLGGYAVPALLKLGRIRVTDWKKQRKKFLLRRFAYHLLTTMEVANPRQALANADKALRLILLRAYGRFRNGEAAAAIIGMTDHADPDVRAAARETLRRYFKGPRPKSKVRRLKLPGGEETPRVQRLYLNYRDRAIIETRRELEQLTQGKYDRSIPGKELVRMLFEVQDRQRTTRWSRRFDEARQRQAQGDLAGAIEVCEEILRQEPTFPGRHQMVDLYLRHATHLTLRGELDEATVLLDRAAMLVAARPGKDSRRLRILADAAYVRALRSEAAGRRQDAVALHRLALSYFPEHLGARVALMHLLPRKRTDPSLLWTIVLTAGLGAPGQLFLLSLLRRLRE